jgi:hypothetical protein
VDEEDRTRRPPVVLSIRSHFGTSSASENSVEAIPSIVIFIVTSAATVAVVRISINFPEPVIFTRSIYAADVHCVSSTRRVALLEVGNAETSVLMAGMEVPLRYVRIVLLASMASKLAGILLLMISTR